MKRFIVLLLCLLTLFLMPGCSSSDDDDNGGGGGGTGVAGAWSGSGVYTQVSDGSSTNQGFTLNLNLADNAGTVFGTFSYVRTSVGLSKSGTVSGTASGGVISLSFSDAALSMTGTYGGNPMSVAMTESFTVGPVAWIRGGGTLSR